RPRLVVSCLTFAIGRTLASSFSVARPSVDSGGCKMSPQTLNVFWLLLPLLLGGVVAAVNSTRINALTEFVEAKARARRSQAAARTGFVYRYVLYPPLWSIVKFSDWTDGFAHRGLKNGARVSATLYLIGLWVVILYMAAIFVLAIAIVVGFLYFLLHA